MKYVITGSTGHISKPVINALLKAGHEVTVVSSRHDRSDEIKSMGAKPAIGSVADQGFLTKTFSGAHAVYTMIPPIQQVTDWKTYIAQIGKNYAEAIKANNIKYVVNLSSVGAEQQQGNGPVDGLHRAEEALNALTDVNIKHLRAGYFYYNLLNNIDMVRNMGVIGSNFGMHDKKMVLVDPADIAAAITDELLTLNFTGHSVEYVASDEVSTDDIAAAIAKAIQQPGLKWVVFTDEQVLQGAVQAGLSEELAKNYTEMGHSLNNGQLLQDYWQHRPAVLGKVKLADFAQSFAKMFNNEAPVPAY